MVILFFFFFFNVHCNENLPASCLFSENLSKNSSIDLKVMSTLVRKNESDESLHLDGITGVNVNRKGNLHSFFKVLTIPAIEIVL